MCFLSFTRTYYTDSSPKGLFPEGIDVLAKIDFFSVGVRRNAFLVAAPLVAM